MMSPTQRTLKWLKDQGYVAGITEKWNPYAKIRQDLFGFIDIVAVHPDLYGILAIQCTSGTHHATRRTKLKEIKASRFWLSAGGRIEIVSWQKQGPRGKRKVWTVRVEEIN